MWRRGPECSVGDCQGLGGLLRVGVAPAGTVPERWVPDGAAAPPRLWRPPRGVAQSASAGAPRPAYRSERGRPGIAIYGRAAGGARRLSPAPAPLPAS